MAKTKLANGTRGKMKDGIRECVGRTGVVTYQIKVPARDALTGKPTSAWQTFATRTAAKEARDKLRSEHHGRPLLVLPKAHKETTVAQWLDAYVANREGIAATTRVAYRNFAAHIKKEIGALRLVDLTPERIERAKGALSHLGDYTRQLVFVLFRAALQRAVDQGKLRSNPTDTVEAPKRQRQEVGEALSPADVGEVLEHLSGHETWLPTAVMGFTGMRVGEVCALRRSSIDLDTLKIRVRATVQRVERKRIVAAAKTETSERDIVITPELADALRRHLAEQERIARELGVTPSPSWLVFQAPKGRWNPEEPRCPAALRDAIRWRLRKTQFKDLNPHDLRHAHATALLRKGVNPRAVAARLGHSVQTLMATYAHLLRGDAEQVAAVFAQEVARSGKTGIPGATARAQSNVKLVISKAA